MTTTFKRPSGRVEDQVTGEVTPQVTPQVTPKVTPQVRHMLAVCDGELLREELQERIGLADRKHFRTDYLRPALNAGMIEMTIPDKPTSSKQKYRITEKGRALLAEVEGVQE